METNISFNKTKIDSAYEEAINFAKSHYENFPVVSFLIPGGLQKHVAIIYWFARTADDFADEGMLPDNERIEKLNHFEWRLNKLINGSVENEFESALAETIKKRNLTSSLFFNLLYAFKQDVVKKSYQNYNELIHYCKHSANPVGRLILELFNIRDEEAFLYSDKICTALQLTNFFQDALIDFKNDRIYFPQDEMRRFGVDHKTFELQKNNSNLRELVKFNLERAGLLFEEGSKLLNYLSGRFRIEIKWTILGGRTILKKIEKNDYNIFIRPKLSKTDAAGLLIKSIL